MKHQFFLNIVDGVRNWNVQFGRVLDAALLPAFVDLICFLNSFWATNDAFIWRWSPNEDFSDKCCYKFLKKWWFVC